MKLKFLKVQVLALSAALLMIGVTFPDDLYGAEKIQKQPSGSDKTEKTEDGDEGGVVEARVDRILKAVGTYLKTAKEFSFRADVTFEELNSKGQKLQYSGTTRVAVRRPDRFHVDYQGDLEARRVWYDGKTVTLLDPRKLVYGTLPAPPQIDGAVDSVKSQYDLSIPLSDLIRSDPYAALMEEVEEGSYVGMHRVRGVRTHHLALRQESLDWQIWIEAGERLVPKKFVITFKNLPGTPQYTAVFTNWEFSPRLSDFVFTADLPENAYRIQFLKIAQSAK